MKRPGEGAVQPTSGENSSSKVARNQKLRRAALIALLMGGITGVFGQQKKADTTKEQKDTIPSKEVVIPADSVVVHGVKISQEENKKIYKGFKEALDLGDYDSAEEMMVDFKRMLERSRGEDKLTAELEATKKRVAEKKEQNAAIQKEETELDQQNAAMQQEELMLDRQDIAQKKEIGELNQEIGEQKKIIESLQRELIQAKEKQLGRKLTQSEKEKLLGEK